MNLAEAPPRERSPNYAGHQSVESRSSGGPQTHIGYVRLRAKLHLEATAVVQRSPWNTARRNAQRLRAQDIVERLRTSPGLSQKDLAQIVGVSRQIVPKWRAGSVKPSTERKQRLVALHALASLISTESDSASWLETVLEEQDSRPSKITIRDVCSALPHERFLEVLEHFRGNVEDHELLDSVMPGRPRAPFRDLLLWSLEDDEILVEIHELGIIAEGASQEEAVKNLVAMLIDALRSGADFYELDGSVEMLAEEAAKLEFNPDSIQRLLIG